MTRGKEKTVHPVKSSIRRFFKGHLICCKGFLLGLYLVVGVKRSDLLSVKTQTGDLSTQEFQKVPTVLGPCGFFFFCLIYQQFAMSCLT